MTGVWQLSTPRELLAKMERELGRMRSAPHEADHAFNFFVTAESLVDWLHPGNKARQKRTALRDSDPLLQATSHLASSAKHFSQLSSHHQSVGQTHLAGAPPPLLMYSLSKFPSHPIRGLHLRVSLTGNAAAALGQTVEALELAERVLSFWSAPGKLPP